MDTNELTTIKNIIQKAYLPFGMKFKDDILQYFLETPIWVKREHTLRGNDFYKKHLKHWDPLCYEGFVILDGTDWDILYNPKLKMFCYERISWNSIKEEYLEYDPYGWNNGILGAIFDYLCYD